MDRPASASVLSLPRRKREASTFEVFERPSADSHGVYDTLDEARGCVSYDRLKEWEIWQGDHIVDESDGPFRSSFTNDTRVLDETATEHLRNALQLLEAKWATFSNRAGHQLVAYEATTVASVRARLQNALDILESPTVLTGESLASFMHDLAQRTV
jgi:hypothetical protein